MTEDFTQICIDLEHYETDPWVAPALLQKEILTRNVVDPCAGTGILTDALKAAAYGTTALDIRDWGYPGTHVQDFLQLGSVAGGEFSVMMNPPFSMACEFVDKAFALGARKVACFQRFAWFESRERREFWDRHTPARIWVCGDRATCWRHDIPVDVRKGKSSTSTAHAFFIFESGHHGGTVVDRIYKTVKSIK